MAQSIMSYQTKLTQNTIGNRSTKTNLTKISKNGQKKFLGGCYGLNKRQIISQISIQQQNELMQKFKEQSAHHKQIMQEARQRRKKLESQFEEHQKKIAEEKEEQQKKRSYSKQQAYLKYLRGQSNELKKIFKQSRKENIPSNNQQKGKSDKNEKIITWKEKDEKLLKQNQKLKNLNALDLDLQGSQQNIQKFLEMQKQLNMEINDMEFEMGESQLLNSLNLESKPIKQFKMQQSKHLKEIEEIRDLEQMIGFEESTEKVSTQQNEQIQDKQSTNKQQNNLSEKQQQNIVPNNYIENQQNIPIQYTKCSKKQQIYPIGIEQNNCSEKQQLYCHEKLQNIQYNKCSEKQQNHPLGIGQNSCSGKQQNRPIGIEQNICSGKQQNLPIGIQQNSCSEKQQKIQIPNQYNCSYEKQLKNHLPNQYNQYSEKQQNLPQLNFQKYNQKITYVQQQKNVDEVLSCATNNRGCLNIKYNDFLEADLKYINNQEEKLLMEIGQISFKKNELSNNKKQESIQQNTNMRPKTKNPVLPKIQKPNSSQLHDRVKINDENSKKSHLNGYGKNQIKIRKWSISRNNSKQKEEILQNEKQVDSKSSIKPKQKEKINQNEKQEESRIDSKEKKEIIQNEKQEDIVKIEKSKLHKLLIESSQNEEQDSLEA